MSLTAEMRLRVREERDRARRAQLEPLQQALAGIVYCFGCGIELDEWTPGCRRCWDRWRRWRERGQIDLARFDRLRLANEDHAREVFSLNGKLYGGRLPRRTWAQNRAALSDQRMQPYRVGSR